MTPFDTYMINQLTSEPAVLTNKMCPSGHFIQLGKFSAAAGKRPWALSVESE